MFKQYFKRFSSDFPVKTAWKQKEEFECNREKKLTSPLITTHSKRWREFLSLIMVSRNSSLKREDTPDRNNDLKQVQADCNGLNVNIYRHY